MRSTRERAFLGRSLVPRRAGRSASGHVCSGRHAGAHHARQRKPLRIPLVWDGDVVIRYLPPYTTELNPAGMRWDIIKKAAANALYGSTDATRRSVRRMLRAGEVGVAEMGHRLLG